MRFSCWLSIALVAVSLAGCASAPGLSGGSSSPRCDRTGNEDQRRAC